MTKACSKCSAVKPVAEFYKDKNRSDGRTAYCRECQKAYVQDYREKNPKKVRTATRRWEVANPYLQAVYDICCEAFSDE